MKEKHCVKMMTQMQTVNVDVTRGFLQKPAQAEVQLNSQGERVEAPAQNAAVSGLDLQEAPLECSYLDISLWDTPLAGPFDALHPPTDDTGLEHAIISCGHVLKSTHDLARWSEKTGARRVNMHDSIDSISDIIIGLVDAAPNVPKEHSNKKKAKKGQESIQQASQVLSCGPVLKSTHDAASAIEKQNTNSAAAAGLLDDVANLGQGQQRPIPQRHSSRRGPTKAHVRQPRSPPPPSQVINCWPVLKSTSWFEKKGRKAVNGAESVSMLNDLGTQALPGKSLQKSASQSAVVSSEPILKPTHESTLKSNIRVSGGGLQSGLDTQGGSHVLLEGGKVKETPEKAMRALHVHV